jgi:hypothetical protein
MDSKIAGVWRVCQQPADNLFEQNDVNYESNYYWSPFTFEDQTFSNSGIKSWCVIAYSESR